MATMAKPDPIYSNTNLFVSNSRPLMVHTRSHKQSTESQSLVRKQQRKYSMSGRRRMSDTQKDKNDPQKIDWTTWSMIQQDTFQFHPSLSSTKD